MRRISWLGKDLLPSQGFCCMQLELLIRWLSSFTPTMNKETYNGKWSVVGFSDLMSRFRNLETWQEEAYPYRTSHWHSLLVWAGLGFNLLQMQELLMWSWRQNRRHILHSHQSSPCSQKHGNRSLCWQATNKLNAIFLEIWFWSGEGKDVGWEWARRLRATFINPESQNLVKYNLFNFFYY
jgi:hypothetical protein